MGTKEFSRFGQILKTSTAVIIPVEPNGRELPEVEVGFNEEMKPEEIKEALKENYEIIDEEE